MPHAGLRVEALRNGRSVSAPFSQADGSSWDLSSRFPVDGKALGSAVLRPLHEATEGRLCLWGHLGTKAGLGGETGTGA